MVQPTVRYALFYLMVILSAVSTSLASVNAYYMQHNYIFPGVEVAGIPLGGYTQAQAAQILQDRLGAHVVDGDTVLGTLYYGTQEWPLHVSDIKFSVDPAETAARAYTLGRTGDILSQLRERFQLAAVHQALGTVVSYNEQLLQNRLQRLNSDVYRAAADAQVVQQSMKIDVRPEQLGRYVDNDQLATMLQSQMRGSFPFRLLVPVVVVTPKVMTADIAEIDTILASYTTEFDNKQENRTKNIALAVEQLNNTLVRSKELFSFNQRVGPRVKERGYEEAPVWSDGQLVPDFGGGVCQVSSTLYNAILLAGLTPNERTPHFQPPGYVPLGQDATVADGLLDFAFPNSLDHNILIQAVLHDNQVTVTILGHHQGERPDLRLKNTIVKTVDPPTIVKQDLQLERGAERVEKNGLQGFQVSVERIGTINGVEVYRETISVDEYQPEAKILWIGTQISPLEKQK